MAAKMTRKSLLPVGPGPSVFLAMCFWNLLLPCWVVSWFMTETLKLLTYCGPEFGDNMGITEVSQFVAYLITFLILCFEAKVFILMRSNLLLSCGLSFFSYLN